MVPCYFVFLRNTLVSLSKMIFSWLWIIESGNSQYVELLNYKWIFFFALHCWCNYLAFIIGTCIFFLCMFILLLMMLLIPFIISQALLYILVLIIFHVNITLHKFLIIDTCIYIHISLITFHDVIITVHDSYTFIPF